MSDAKGYNILVASDTKASMNHWELFSMNGDGTFTAYLPGARPDHVRSEAVITDNKWHTLGIQYEEDRVRLYVDGRQVAEEAIRRKPLTRVLPGDLALARLVEGHIGLRGELGEVSIRSGIHDDLVADTTKALPQERNAQIGYWVYSEVVSSSDKTVSPMKTFDRAPIEPEANPFWKAYVNRDREYDYYAKQALFYGKQKWEDLPEILPEFPGLDGAGTGHWGNQNDDETWKDGRVRDMDHGSMVSGVFKGGGLTIPRAVSLKLGDGYHAVFNEDTLRFEYAWNGKHVEWSDVRRGFMHGIPPGPSKKVDLESAPEAGSDASYLGLYRVGDEVYFAYEDAGQTRYRHAVVKDGKVVENVLTKIPGPGKPVWPERPRTTGELGKEQPYAIDTLTLPYDNPWNVLFFSAGVDFLAENRIAICNIHGDVWICDVSGEGLQQLTWKRFAGGLYQPLGLKVVDGVIHVMCRDALLALHDLNGDDEADFYECVSNVHETSKGGHDFITGLQRDNQGRWFFASGNQGICRVSPDGKNLDVLATGFRNPNGLGISPDGSVVLTSVQEGTWTPASAICDASLGGHYGAGGPKAGPRGYVPPMLYLPRGVDNSSGGQTYIESDRWGPVQGQWVHYSGGFAKAFLVLREVFPDGESQAAAIQIPGSFLSGVHRGRFSPYDGQLYVAGAQGWGNYGTQDGCLQRVRFTGGSYPYPIAFETRDNGILLTFAEQPSEALTDKDKWFAQQWNYLYGPGYGSAEYSVKQPETPGHDPLQIRSVHRVGDGRQLFLEIPQLQPVHQLHLHCANDPRLELFATLHQLGKPYTEFPGYEPIQKTSLGGEALTAVDDFSPAALMQACAACHHPTQKVVGPPFAEIRQRYANNPDGIVKWAMNPENKNPELPPMPSFNFLGEEKLRIIADYILAGDE